MKGQKLFLPITKFSQIPPTQFSTYDDRFIPAEIVVMHSGINKNQSLFTEESIASSSWSLTDIPILGFIKSINDKEHDFDEHNIEVVMSNDDIKVRTLGRIIGNIPKDNNYHYTYYPNKDEVYVVVEGYLWKEYMNEALEIFENQKEKSVSMEILIDDGFMNDDGIFCITKYRYIGICILGNDVDPAMEGAKITVDNAPLELYSHKNTKEEVMDLDNIITTEVDEVVESVEETQSGEEVQAEPVEEIEVEEDSPEETVEEIAEPAEEEVEPVEEETPFNEAIEIPSLTAEEKAELEELRLFKQQLEKEQRENEIKELFASCEARGLEVSDIKENTGEKTIDEIKNEIGVRLLESTLSFKEQVLPESDSKAIVQDVATSKDEPYGIYTKRLKK